VRFVLPFLLALTACAPTGPQPLTWHKDVAPIIQRKCGTCHVAGGIAPFSLNTFAEWQEMKVPALTEMRAGRMPPFPGRPDCANYQPTLALSAEQRDTIEQWVDEGEKEGDPSTFAALPGMEDRLTRVDLSLPMKEPFTPTRPLDEYRCFLIDWPYDVPMYITGYQLRPGRQNIVHHADIFYLNPLVVSEWEQRDAADPAPGWECYSIPIGQEGGWIGTYVPGNRGVDFPAESGLKIPVGSKIYFQVHYNMTHAPAGPDVSTLDLRIESRVRKQAGVFALSDPAWISQKTMTIPAYQKDVTHTFSLEMADFASIINPAFTDGAPMKLYATTMHLHELGQAASLTLERTDGSKACAVDIPKWDFDWQLAYSMKEPITILTKDKLKVSCTWDNTAEHQPVINGVKAIPKDRNWGTRTQDEMCVAGIYVTQ
jgi:hypothetical protein